MFKLQIEKTFEDFHLSVDAQVTPGRILVLLGPSGSGKSTLLRCIAGLEYTHSGMIACQEEVWLDTKKDINLTPQQRRTGFLFQDYALFDHLNVEKNIGFGVAKEQRQVKVDEWLKRLHIEDLATMMPAQLSGGQKQRVALARAMAIEPQLLLLDEPLSAIDFSLRRKIRRELRELLRRWQRTAILVTHDLEEARYFADELFIMHRGKLLQQGNVTEIFQRPASAQVASIVGWKNRLGVERYENGKLAGSWGALSWDDSQAGEGTLVFCADAVTLTDDEKSAIQGRVLHGFQSGDGYELEIVLEDESVISVEWLNSRGKPPADDEKVGLIIDTAKCLFFSGKL